MAEKFVEDRASFTEGLVRSMKNQSTEYNVPTTLYSETTHRTLFSFTWNSVHAVDINDAASMI